MKRLAMCAVMMVLTLSAMNAQVTNQRSRAEDSTRFVSGMITDSTGAPLVHATVFISGTRFSSTTDSIGHFVLKGVPSGKFSVRAVATDFRPKQVDDLTWSGKPLTVNFTLYPFIEEPVPAPVAPSRLPR